MPSIPSKSIVGITLAAICLLCLIYASDLIPISNSEGTETTMATTLKHLKIAPKEAHTATVIFLHVRDRVWLNFRSLTASPRA